MAASASVLQVPHSRNSLVPRHGVITLFGYGIKVHVDRGHLTLQDGIGVERSEARLPRVGHGLRRLIVIGADGMVSLAALRWLADQNAAFVMLERDGSVLSTTGPVRSSDARLRRAQALAHESGAALRIARELIDQKLAGQDQMAREKLSNPEVAVEIARSRTKLATAKTVEEVRFIESQAGLAYWSGWAGLPINFPKLALPRVPDHWRVFGTRRSPLSGSPRLAANPANAMLNYLYAVLESEARLAAAALGLDPGLGFLHVDTQTRDSLACDLMEPVRPQVDAYVLDWLMREPLRKEWFFEERNGNCRLMASLAVRLSETALSWGRAVAPFAEWAARTLWFTSSHSKGERAPATRLTQNRKREAKDVRRRVPALMPQPESICRNCGVAVPHGQKHCGSCTPDMLREKMPEVARLGRLASNSPEAQARRADSQKRQHKARKGWKASELPAGFDEKFYLEQIQPRMAGIPCSVIASALGVSIPYAADIRAGRRVPHPRRWEVLRRLAGVSG